MRSPVTPVIKIKRGTSAEWAKQNPVLSLGEWGLEKDSNQVKIGDGSTTWNNLPYIRGAGGTVGPQGSVGPQGIQGERGLQGLKGDKGDKGDNGMDGAQGPQGAQGPRGNDGPQGIQGVQGIKGDKGDAGADGIAHSFAAGSIPSSAVINNTPQTIATTDSAGSSGQMVWDDNFIYLRTTTGWKKVALSAI